jgi:hypothetical protein
MAVELSSLYSDFDPLPLPPGDPRYVDTTVERNVPTLLTSLNLALMGDKARSILFTGLTGDGKTTTLNYVRNQQEIGGRFVAYGQALVDVDIDPSFSFEDLVIFLLGVTDRTLIKVLDKTIQEPWYKRIWNEFCDVANLPISLRGLEIHLGPFGKIMGVLKDSPSAKQAIRNGLREASASLVQMANDYLGHARQSIKEAGRGGLVVILDDMEKLPGKGPSGKPLDEELFVDRAAQVRSLDCEVIYTIRLSTYRAHSEELPILYGAPIFVPMLPPRDRDGKNIPRSLQRMREIVALRIAYADGKLSGELKQLKAARAQALKEDHVNQAIASAFESIDVADSLCLASGGHMRELMLLVQASIVQAITANQPKIRQADVDAAVLAFDPFRRSEAEEYTADLRRIRETKSITGLKREVQSALLSRRLVHEYFDHSLWYDICPLVAQSVTGE